MEPGEDDAAALVREMREETGLDVAPGRLIGRITRGPYTIADYACTVLGGDLRAGDDALDARWCTAADLADLPLVDGLLDVLAAWGALPDPGRGEGCETTPRRARGPQPRGSGRPGCSPPRASP